MPWEPHRVVFAFGEVEMEWVNRRLDEKDEKARKNKGLTVATEQLFERFLMGIRAALETYNQRSARPNKEEARLEGHAVQFGTLNQGKFQKTPGSASVELNHIVPVTITANYSKGQAATVFVMELDGNGYLRLKHENQIVSVDEATKIVLWDFLFN
jgi:hypothetical protein